MKKDINVNCVATISRQLTISPDENFYEAVEGLVEKLRKVGWMVDNIYLFENEDEDEKKEEGKEGEEGKDA